MHIEAITRPDGMKAPKNPMGIHWKGNNFGVIPPSKRQKEGQLFDDPNRNFGG